VLLPSGQIYLSVWFNCRRVSVQLQLECTFSATPNKPYAWQSPWLHVLLRNSSFPCFPFLLDPFPRFLVPSGKQGSMIQSIFLNFLLLRKHNSDLNNFEYFWRKKTSTLLIELQSHQQIVQVLLTVWTEWDQLTWQSGNVIVSMREKICKPSKLCAGWSGKPTVKCVRLFALLATSLYSL